MKKIGKQLKEQNIMKKTLYIAAAVIAVMFAASCQKEDVQAAKKGMTLSANVEETKATITDNGDKTWKFSWELNDVVNVTAPNGNPYDFTYDGKSFKNAEAEPAEGEWKAVYPKSYTTEGISFVHQDGTLKSAMEKYLLTGSCPSDGSATLSMPMTPRFAILKIKNNQSSLMWFGLTNNAMNESPVAYTNGKISTVGNANMTRTNCEYGELNGGGEEKYYIVPAGTYKLLYFNNIAQKFNAPQGTKASKTLVAGHIYNVTF